MGKDINKELSDFYKDEKCKYCGRSYPDTILNIEGRVHHNAKGYSCVDTKQCNKVRKGKFPHYMKSVIKNYNKS